MSRLRLVQDQVLVIHDPESEAVAPKTTIAEDALAGAVPTAVEVAVDSDSVVVPEIAANDAVSAGDSVAVSAAVVQIQSLEDVVALWDYFDHFLQSNQKHCH